MKPAAIIDTNVVVAGLISAQIHSPVVRILDGMLAASFAYVASEALLAEYRRVLLRPRLQKLHGLSEADVDTLLIELAQHCIVLTPAKTAALNAPDPGDQFLWDMLASRGDVLLVTADKRLQQDAAMASRVLSPQAFVERLRA